MVIIVIQINCWSRLGLINENCYVHKVYLDKNSIYDSSHCSVIHLSSKIYRLWFIAKQCRSGGNILARIPLKKIIWDGVWKLIYLKCESCSEYHLDTNCSSGGHCIEFKRWLNEASFNMVQVEGISKFSFGVYGETKSLMLVGLFVWHSLLILDHLNCYEIWR